MTLLILSDKTIFILLTLLVFLVGTYYNFCFVQAQEGVTIFKLPEDTFKQIGNGTGPFLRDDNLKIETVIKGLEFPTSMAFLGPNDILVLEKNNGTVRRIVNGNMLDEPLLDVNVGNKKERGMLGIAISEKSEKDHKQNAYVFLYYTETKSKDGEDLEEDGVVLGNRLYRYELENSKLINPKLMLDIPFEPGSDHQGGVVLIGPDENVYLITGDVNHFGEAQNKISGEPDGTSGILRVTQDGMPVGKGILGDTHPLNLYYAYGIRNGFGMDFDPVTGKLWDTENGIECCDEINLVNPGFNSGWATVQGIWKLNQSNRIDKDGIFNEILNKGELNDFDGKGKYSSPEFMWNYSVGPSAIKFLNSANLGQQYKNDIFVGNVNHQNLYHFDLTENRTELLLKGKLIKKILESQEDPEDIVFAKGLGRITDIDVGPDGNLYVLSHSWDKDNQNLQNGSIFKISKLVKKGDNATMGQETRTNYADDTLSVSKETDKSISGNGSLRVHIRPAATVEEAVNSSWSVVSTDFIPADKNKDYEYSLNVSALDVNQLHSKVIYYNSSKKEIGSDFIFTGQDGTFSESFSNSFLPHIDTEYIKLQMLVRPALGKNSTYNVDNIKILEKGPSLTIHASNDTTPQLGIERIFTGLNSTTDFFLGPNIAFLGPNDVLALEDVDGKVWRITNGQLRQKPLIDLNAYVPDGLIGIATSKSQNGSTYVFLYLNEALMKDGVDVDTSLEGYKANDTLDQDREGDRLYRFKLINNNLVEPKLLFSIPDKTTNFTGEIHHGGEVGIGPDNNVYFIIGDIDGHENPDSRTNAQNYENGTKPDGRAGILRLTQDGNVIGNGILGNEYPLDMYYAYGIRNSFGMDFDPVTGNLWDTENGPNYGDEINLVKPGFNSGWNKVQGFWKPKGEEKGKIDLQPSNLVDFNGKGVYSGPEFTWINTVAPTAIKFFNSDKFGAEYKNDMFVADLNNGNIYHFDLNESRTSLLLDGPLKDKIADRPEELDDVIFAKGFNGIVDLQVGPDGYLYVLSNGSIYRILPTNS